MSCHRNKKEHLVPQDIFPLYERKFIVTRNLFPVTGNKFPMTGNKFPDTGNKSPMTVNKFLVTVKKFPDIQTRGSISNSS